MRVLIAIALATVLNLFLNSYWLSLLYTSKAYWGWVAARASSYLVEAPLQVVVLFLCLKGLSRLKLPQSMRLGGKES